MCGPPDPEMRKGCPAKSSPDRKLEIHEPAQITETPTDIQVRSLQQRLAVGYSLAISLAALIWGAGPR